MGPHVVRIGIGDWGMSSFEVPTVHVIQDSREFVERFAEDVVLAREWFAAEEKGGGDWEFVTRTSEGVDVWRQAVPESPGLYMWLTHGPIQVDAAVFARVYNDLDPPGVGRLCSRPPQGLRPPGRGGRLGSQVRTPERGHPFRRHKLRRRDLVLECQVPLA